MTQSSRSISVIAHARPPSENAILMLGEAHRHLRPQPVGRGGQRVRGEQGAVELERRARGAGGRPARRPVVEADHGLGLLARPQERVPVLGVHRRQPEVDRVLGHAHGLEPARRVLVDHLGCDLRVGEPRDLERDDAVGVRPDPLLDVPVVPCRARRPGRAPGRGSGRTPHRRSRRSATGSTARRRRRRGPCRAPGPRRPSSPRRISSNRAGSMFHWSFGRPEMALSPICGYSTSSYSHSS